MFEIGSQAVFIPLAIVPLLFVCLLGGTVLIDLVHQWIEQRTKKRSMQSLQVAGATSAADLRRILANIDVVSVSGVLEVRD
jgi:nitrogen fixation/metabolism regulation signal transduction histidine kinase